MDLHVYRNAQDRWHDLRELSRSRGGVLAINAFTLTELIEKLTPDLRVATIGQRLHILRRTLEQTKSSALPATPRYAFDAINELKAAGVSGSPTDLHGILAAYNRELKVAGLVDPDDRIWIAASRIAEGFPWLRRFQRVVLHALYDLSESEFALVRSLVETLPDGGMVILFNATANVKPTQFAEWTWQRFIYDESLAERTFPEFCRPSGPNGPLLERLFVFDSPQELLEPLDSLRIVRASGRYREIEVIGGEIAELLQRGESANEMAVVVRHIETYGEMIEDVFSRYGIPHAFETGVPLLRVPFIKYWFARLDLIPGERGRPAMARVLSSAYFEPRYSPEVDFEKELIQFGYIDRYHMSASDLARRKNSSLTTELERIESWLNQSESARRTVVAWMEHLKPPRNLTTRDLQAWRSLSEELESVAGLNDGMSFEEFRTLALEIASVKTIDRLSPHPYPPGVARVRVMGPNALGCREYRWIFAPGLADGEFPARSATNPLLSEETVEAINAGIRPRRLHTLRDRNRREPLYLFMLLDSVRDRVTLTYPATSLEGEPVIASIYVGEISRHFAQSPVLSASAPTMPRESGECLRHIADQWRLGSIDDRAASGLLGKDLVHRIKLEQSGSRRGDVGRDVVRPTAWHPSELNALASCPFVFLARHRLKLRAEELPDFEIPIKEIGMLAHEVLRDFYAAPVPVLESEAMARMEAIIRRRLAEADISGRGVFSTFDPSLWRIRRNQLVAALRQYVRFAVKDSFDGYETLVEYLGEPLPSAQFGSITLGGRPDHVAVRRLAGRIESIRVDDFKYSAASSVTNKILRDSFQLPVYAYLAARALGADESTQIDGRYLLLRSPSTPVSAQAIDAEVLNEVQSRIELLVEKTRHGQLHPDPADRQDCLTCDYRRLCRQYGD